MVHMFKLIYIKKFYKVCIGLQGLNQSGVPWTPRLCASIWRGRRGTCCSARGVMYALASSGVPLASLGLRASVLLFGVAGAGLATLQGA